MYKRNLESSIIQLLKEFRIVYLAGPRQAGKTTLTKSIAAQCGLEYITFDNQTVLEAAKSDPIDFYKFF